MDQRLAAVRIALVSDPKKKDHRRTVKSRAAACRRPQFGLETYGDIVIIANPPRPVKQTGAFAKAICCILLRSEPC
jgi:hypothetical protein